MKFLPLDQVRLLDGPFARALEVDLRYALDLDPDRLLAPFRREAGLPAKAPSYGNWEDSGLDGHIAGHQLSALAFLHASTGDVEARRRPDAMIAELAECQRANGGGYVGGIPGGQALFESLATGGAGAVAALGSSEHWVPWYNLHKTFQGLIDAHVVTGDELPLRIVTALADWWLPIADRIDDATFERMLDTEFGGMNDAFAQLARLTAREAYAAQAERFSHRAILDPLLRGDDALTGLHANTQIPKAVGYASTAVAVGDDAYLRAADAFWRTVVEHRTVAIGGNSVREHFHDAHDFTSMIDDREGPEFCNTYNMLKLTRALAEHELRPELLDFAERAVFNHVLASQHPERGGFVYFTSMRPRHYRVYSQPQLGFWCCVGTGLEAQARSAAEWVFGIEDGAPAVNLYLPAQALIDLPGAALPGVSIRVEADLPRSGEVAIRIDPAEARAFPLRLRVPAWAEELAGGLVDLRVNGSPAEAGALPGAVLVERTWEPGDRVTFRLPVDVRAERLPDGSPWQAFLAGPSVLATRDGDAHLDGLYADDSRMGHVAHGPLLPFADLPVLSPGEVPGGLEPFSGIHDSRYTVYWPVSDGDRAARAAQLRDLDDGLAVDAATVDAVAFGEQQPESDHGFTGTGTSVLTTGDRRWRTTTESMSVRMRTPGARTLRIRYRLAETPTAVTVRIDDEIVAEERFGTADRDGGRDAGRDGEVLDIDYGIGEVAGRTTAQVRFTAADGLLTPAIGAVRLLR